MRFRNRQQQAGSPAADPALLDEPATGVPEPERLPLHGTPEAVRAPDHPTVGAVVDEVMRAVSATERTSSQVNVRFWGSTAPAVLVFVQGKLSERDGHRIFRALDADGAVLGPPYGTERQQAELVGRIDQLGITLEVVITEFDG